MKTKNKVTTAFIVSFALLFTIVGMSIYITKREAKKVSVEVAAGATAVESVDEINDLYLAVAQTNLDATTETSDADVQAKGLIKQETGISIKEENAQLDAEEDLTQELALDDETVHSAVSESVEEIITSTLSVSEPAFTFNKVLPKVNEFLNIRSKADSNAEVVGKLYKDSYAVILERGNEWTKIKSGSVEGYVSNEYLYFDDQAVTVAKSLDAFQAIVTAGSVNVRTKPTTESDVLSKATSGTKFTHVPEMDHEEWVAVLYDKDGKLAYISKEFVETKFTLKTAVSIEEEEKAKKEAKKAEEAKKEAATKALAEAKKHKPKTTNRAAITVSDEEIMLLATVVAMEAGGESYEGQLAVANVVINRMLDGYWGKTIKSVVYAPGQFSGANSGRIEKFAKRVTESNKRAAIEALAGNNNIGDYMYFRMKNTADYSSYKKYYVLGCHCFYSR
ncbi:MAG: cell wall hydrolase [Clostridiales bacterium]|nr:cell wall hydrolase [Clostridiales bacterium]